MAVVTQWYAVLTLVTSMLLTHAQWTDWMDIGGCLEMSSKSAWTGWETLQWPPEHRPSQKHCFKVWKQTQRRTCLGSQCDGPTMRWIDCSCPKAAKIQDCQELSEALNTTDVYLPDPCSCSCFYRCIPHDNNWELMKSEKCCSPCTLWDPTVRSCTHVTGYCVQTNESLSLELELLLKEAESYECYLEEDETDIAKFWNGIERMECAKNTVFSQDMCNCVTEFDPGMQRLLTLISFDSKPTNEISLDMGDAKFAFSTLAGESAYLNGKSSMSIERLPYEMHNQLAVSIFFKAMSGANGAMGLLTNGYVHGIGKKIKGCKAGTYSTIYAALLDARRLRAGLRLDDGTVAESVIEIPTEMEEFMAEEMWHHLLLSWNKKKMFIWLDAELAFSAALSGNMTMPACPIRIGVSDGPFGLQYFHGHVDQISFYQTYLRYWEIQELATHPKKTYNKA